MSDDERLVSLKAEIDKLNEKVKKNDDGPWYRKPATVISLLALMFSFGTTVFSAFNSHEEGVRSNRRDVRALLQRLSKLPIDNYELMQKYKGAGQGEALSGMLNQENILLATQAAELMDRYPDSFGSTEYFAVAFALSSSNILGKVPRLFQRAMDLSTTSNDYNAAARAYGGYLYSKGEYTEGKRLFGEALNVWNKFPERNAYVVNSTDLVTLMYWSQAEFGVGNKKPAKDLLTEAKRKLAELPPGPMTESLKNQINYTAQFVE